MRDFNAAGFATQVLVFLKVVNRKHVLELQVLSKYKTKYTSINLPHTSDIECKLQEYNYRP